MNKKIIIVEGMLASGKSTFAKLLANRLSVPCFVKDDFKIAICNSLELLTREEKSKFSVVTFDAMMYVAERDKTEERGQVNKIGFEKHIETARVFLEIKNIVCD